MSHLKLLLNSQNMNSENLDDLANSQILMFAQNKKYGFFIAHN